VRVTVALVAGVAALTNGPAPAWADARGAADVVTPEPHRIEITPADVVRGSTGVRTLAGHFAALRPGDTLVLGPGVYNAGYTRPNVRPGTAEAPIVVTASRPSKTLIKGQLKLWDAHHWQLRNLRIRATVPGGDALYIGGGRNWVVSGGEFYGARSTGGYTNVGIGTGYTSSPSGFRFTANCVHGAGRTKRENQDHNVYVNFSGSGRTGGSIDRNIIFDHPNGAGVKLGFGGVEGARGPWGVRVVQNTVASGGRQILLHGNVRNNVIQGNLLAFSTKHFQKLAKTTAIYSNMITTRTNRYAHNYVYSASMVNWDLNAALVDAGDNRLRADPRFASRTACTAWRTRAAGARPYGRYGTGRFPR
jgi:hypothetical protein